MEQITVKEKGKELHYSYEDIMNYHGVGYPAGVAYAFQAMRRAFPLLADGDAPERREIVVRTAFTGLGGRDALEMVTRCLTDGRLLVDGKMPEAANAVESPGGRYYFAFTYRGRAVAVQLNPALGHEEFNCLARKPDRRAEDETALARMRLELPEPVGEIRQGSRRLPPLLPDFNSVGAILQDWDLHNFMATAGGCPGSMIELPDHPAYRLHKSRLDDVQVALGCDELLKNAVAEDASAAEQKTTALLSGAALTMAGFDYDGLTKELINEGVNCVLLPANGFDPGPVGATEAFLRLGQTMIKESPKQPDRVNILGYDPMVFVSESKIAHGIEHMDRRALDCYILGSRGEEDVQRASGAALNWVVSAEGLPLARYMEICFGTPMLCGIPIGKYAMLHWRKRVNELTGRDDEEIELPQTAAPCGCQPRIVLIGEPMLTKSMAASLENDLGLKRTERFIYDPRGALRQLYEKEFPKLSYFSGEEELSEILRDVDAWIADPVYKESVPDAKALFVPIPDPLLSGMKYADLPYDIFGKKGGMYLANALKDLIAC